MLIAIKSRRDAVFYKLVVIIIKPKQFNNLMKLLLNLNMLLIDKNSDRLKMICSTYHVDKMYLFGSALNSKFNDESDIDFLVKFKSFELSQYFENYFDLKESLKKLFGREIDLLEEQTLKNPILIQSINKSKELIYG